MVAISPLPSAPVFAHDRRRPPLPGNLERLILAIGSERLSALLFDFMRAEFGIEHTVIARCRRDDPIEVLYARNAHDSARTAELCLLYTRHYHTRDPVLCRLPPARSRELLVCSLALSDIHDAAYQSRFFLEPDFSGKLVIISRTPEQALYMNFYRSRQDGVFGASDLGHMRDCGSLLSAIAEAHYSLHAASTPSLDGMVALVRRLETRSALSEREVQTCARIAMGLPAARIASELGVSKYSAVTYRRRAFDKLGIAGHKELFALVLRNRFRIS